MLLSLVHIAFALIGVWGIARMSRTALSTVSLFAVTLALCAVMALYVFMISEPPNLFEDFKTAYLAAGRAVLAGPSALAPELELGAHGFVNIPIVAYLFSPFALLPARLASLAFLLVGAVSVLAAWHLLCRHYRFDRTEAAISLFLVACFGPLLYSVREGNTSHILLVAIIGGLVLSRGRKDFSAGAAFAAAAIIKPPLLLIGVYYACRGRWKVAAGGLALCSGVALLSVALFGWDMHVLWFQQFREYAGDPMPGYNAQSLATAASRFVLGPESFLNWDPQPLPDLVRLGVLAGTFGLLALGVATGIRARNIPEREDLELSLLLAFICIASTVSWSHYYVWLLPGFAFVYARLKDAGTKTWLIPASIAAFALAMPAEYLGTHGASGIQGVVSGVVVSHLLWGGLIFYAVLAAIGAPSFALSRNKASTPSAAK